MGETERGRVTWLTSEEDGGGPDVGMILGLGNGASLYVGEISNAELDAHDLSETEDGLSGWWIVLHRANGFEVIAPAVSVEAGRELFDAIFAAVQGADHIADAGKMVTTPKTNPGASNG